MFSFSFFRNSLRQRRQNTFYSDFGKISTELRHLLLSTEVREVLLITGATIVNPRETWCLRLPPKKYGSVGSNKPNVSFQLYFIKLKLIKLTCIGQLLMSDLMETKRVSGHLHIVLGNRAQHFRLCDYST